MMPPQTRESLGARVWNSPDQRRFAELSGDFNPVHLDPIAARRDLFGEVVVHGMHGTLGALNDYCRFLRRLGVGGVRLTKISVRFPGPILLGQRVETFVTDATDGNTKLQSFDGDRLVLDVRLEWVRWVRTAPNTATASPASRPLLYCRPRDDSFASLANRSGKLDLVLDDGLADALFPELSQMISAVTIAELLAVTRLVGMECPGMRSVLGKVSLVQTAGMGNESALTYKVVQTDDRFSLVKLAVTGPSLSGSIEAFYRPDPVGQPTVAEVGARIRQSGFATDFAAQCSLIVGGSRGLGEVTAKIVAATGGHAVITYQHGREDAHKIAAEITAAGLRGEARQLDVYAPDEAVAELHRAGIRPRHVYYFASPKIFVSKSGLFDSDVLARFTACYVDGFYKVYRACRRHWDYPLIFFYPSSVAVDEKNKELVEYGIAKIAGEALAHQLMEFDRQLSVIIRRLPRIATDQTVTLMRFPAADALDTMLSVVRDLTVSQAATRR